MAPFERARVSVDQRQEMARILDLTLRDNGISPQITRRVVYSYFFTGVADWCEPEWFTLGYTGWRGADRDKVWSDLTRLRRDLGPMRLIVGFDPKNRTPAGGDNHAYDWGRAAPGVVVECLPAPWDAHPRLKWSAGFYRNGAIVERALAAVGGKGMLAHLHPESRGAAATAAYAKARGLEVWEKTAI